MPPSPSSPGRTPAPRRWLVLSVPAPPRGQEPLVVEALRALGGRTVERVGDRFVAHVPEPGNVDALLRRAEGVLRAATPGVRPVVSWRWQDHREWAARWRDELEPRRVTRRIVVAPTERSPEVREGDVLVRLDPGTAFGTAQHPTTRSCLRFLDTLLAPGDRVADVGAGSGILSVAAALLGAGCVLALEADPHACAQARTNVAVNGVGDRVEVRKMEVGPPDLPRLGHFDGIVANLDTGSLRSLLPGFRSALARGGWLVLSGVIRSERELLRVDAARWALELVEEELEEGWWTGTFARKRGRGS